MLFRSGTGMRQLVQRHQQQALDIVGRQALGHQLAQDEAQLAQMTQGAVADVLQGAPLTGAQLGAALGGGQRFGKGTAFFDTRDQTGGQFLNTMHAVGVFPIKPATVRNGRWPQVDLRLNDTVSDAAAGNLLQARDALFGMRMGAEQAAEATTAGQRVDDHHLRCFRVCFGRRHGAVLRVVLDLLQRGSQRQHNEQAARPEAILATNTSALKVGAIASAVGHSERVLGLHFFNPAPAMSLVEIVRAITSSDETIAECRAFAEACGKGPVEVKDQAGFIVNALLFPYLNNAIRLMDAGVATRDDIDAAMKGGCGFPMGPLALLDLVGLDTSLSILEALYAEFKDPNYAPAPVLRRMVSAQRLGRKSGAGFYDYARK